MFPPQCWSTELKYQQKHKEYFSHVSVMFSAPKFINAWIQFPFRISSFVEFHNQATNQEAALKVSFYASGTSPQYTRRGRRAFGWNIKSAGAGGYFFFFFFFAQTTKIHEKNKAALCDPASRRSKCEHSTRRHLFPALLRPLSVLRVVGPWKPMEEMKRRRFLWWCIHGSEEKHHTDTMGLYCCGPLPPSVSKSAHACWRILCFIYPLMSNDVSTCLKWLLVIMASTRIAVYTKNRASTEGNSILNCHLLHWLMC